MGTAGAAEVRRYAGVLRKAVRLLGIRYCAMLLSCYNTGVLREAVGLLGIRYCAKLLSCCDAGVLLKAVGC